MNAYPKLFAIEINNQSYSGCPTIVNPSILPDSEATMDDMRQFCHVDPGQDLILEEVHIEEIEQLPDVPDLVANIFTLPYASEDPNDNT